MPEETKTDANLKAAFAGESQANRKYLAFAQKAERDGFPNVARAFRAAAQAETVHALNHLRALRAVGNTAENLEEGIAGERYEHAEMYPEFLAAAESAGEKRATVTFRYAMEAEKGHEVMYRACLDAVRQGKDYAESAFWVCEVCGYTHVGTEAPSECPVCKVGKEKFASVA